MFDDLLTNTPEEKEKIEDEVEIVYRDFWKGILEKNGQLDMNQLKKELCDFHSLILNSKKVYDHVTGGKISNIFTDPDIVCTMADDNYFEEVQSRDIGNGCATSKMKTKKKK
jgi:hypothetical protein